jgi:hypothetical protein
VESGRRLINMRRSPWVADPEDAPAVQCAATTALAVPVMFRMRVARVPNGTIVGMVNVEAACQVIVGAKVQLASKGFVSSWLATTGYARPGAPMGADWPVVVVVHPKPWPVVTVSKEVFICSTYG